MRRPGGHRWGPGRRRDGAGPEARAALARRARLTRASPPRRSWSCVRYQTRARPGSPDSTSPRSARERPRSALRAGRPQRGEPWRPRLRAVEAEAPRVAELVAYVGLGTGDRVPKLRRARPERQPDHPPGVDVVVPEPDDASPVDDGVVLQVRYRAQRALARQGPLGVGRVEQR